MEVWRCTSSAVRFPRITTPMIRVLMTSEARSETASYRIALEAIQIFNANQLTERL
jgi:hypothetical protein